MFNHLNIEAEKRAMRVGARAVRQAVSADERVRAAEEVARLGLDFLKRSPGVVAAYYPVRSEFDCMPLLRRVANEGWTLALPVINRSRTAAIPRMDVRRSP